LNIQDMINNIFSGSEERQFASRAVASIIALGIGDAAGDLGRCDEVRQRYGILTRLLPEGKSTDDTEFTVLSARSLLDCPGEYTADFVARTWRELVLSDGGAGERGGMPLYGALSNLARGVNPPLSGQDNVFNVDDGAAMRSVPFGIVGYGDTAKAADLAGIDASVSHDKDGIWAARAIAASITVALRGASADEVITAGRKQIPEDSWLGRKMKETFRMLEETEDPDDAYEALHTLLWTPKHSSAPEAIPQIYGLYKLAEGQFRRGFILSANFGRDADTICALTLALCAAGEGLGVFPEEWIEQVRKPAGVCLRFAAKEDMVDLGIRLASMAIKQAG
jgi:ADP-ribosylglycohydrolase